jgi:hypothetical protein
LPARGAHEDVVPGSHAQIDDLGRCSRYQVSESIGNRKRGQLIGIPGETSDYEFDVLRQDLIENLNNPGPVAARIKTRSVETQPALCRIVKISKLAMRNEGGGKSTVENSELGGGGAFGRRAHSCEIISKKGAN